MARDPTPAMIKMMARWMLAGSVVAGSVGGLVALGIETAYWLGRLDPVVPHYLDADVLRVWPTAGWLLYVAFGGTGRAVVVCLIGWVVQLIFVFFVAVILIAMVGLGAAMTQGAG